MTVWTVPATIIRIVDADTFDVALDLGWRITYHAKVRLAGVNAPEMSTPAGRAAREWVIRTLTNTPDFRPLPPGPPPAFAIPAKVVSRSLDKYGRVLGDVYYDLDPTGAGRRHLNVDLLTNGHAVAA